MTSIKHILAPTDFTHAGAQALETALGLALQFEAKLTLLHAYQIPASGYEYAKGLLWPLDDLSQAAKKELDLAVARFKDRCPKLEGLLACGDPAQQILEVAKSVGADWIVLGTHGRRGVAHLLLGSVAEKVLRSSPVPVLVVPSKERSVEQGALA